MCILVHRSNGKHVAFKIFSQIFYTAVGKAVNQRKPTVYRAADLNLSLFVVAEWYYHSWVWLFARVSCGFCVFSPCVDFLWLLRFPITFQQHVRAQSHRMHAVGLQMLGRMSRFEEACTEKINALGKLPYYIFLLYLAEIPENWWRSGVGVEEQPFKFCCVFFRIEK